MDLITAMLLFVCFTLFLKLQRQVGAPVAHPPKIIQFRPENCSRVDYHWFQEIQALVKPLLGSLPLFPSHVFLDLHEDSSHYILVRDSDLLLCIFMDDQKDQNGHDGQDGHAWCCIIHPKKGLLFPANVTCAHPEIAGILQKAQYMNQKHVRLLFQQFARLQQNKKKTPKTIRQWMTLAISFPIVFVSCVLSDVFDRYAAFVQQ